MSQVLRRVRAVLGVDKYKILEVLARAQAMHDGMAAELAVYVTPTLPLPDFLGLIQNTTAAHQLVHNRTIGAAAARDVERDLLYTGMETERMFVQTLADAAPGRAISIIQNAGLVVAGSPVRNKALLTLRNGKPSGTVECYANVGLLVAASGGTKHQYRYFNWSYTVTGGASFVTAPSTPVGSTTIHGLVPLTEVGVRVSLTNPAGTGAWSNVVKLLVL